MELEMIEPLKGFPANIVAFACRGHVTKSDHETVLIPTVEKAVLQHEKLRMEDRCAGFSPL